MDKVRISAACKCLTALTLTLALAACHSPAERLRTGDLLFVGTSEEAGSMDEAIVAATGELTHVAIIQVTPDGTPWVIDATPQRGVGRYPLDSLLQANPGAAFQVKRLKDTTGVSRFVGNALRWVGKPYDLAFLPDNEAYYCSELVRDAYRLSFRRRADELPRSRRLPAAVLERALRASGNARPAGRSGHESPGYVPVTAS